MGRGRARRISDWARVPEAPQLGEDLDPLVILLSRRAVQRTVQRRHAVRRAITGLPPRQRRLIELLYGLNGESPMTVAQAGLSVGLSRATAYRVRQRALANLRTELGDTLARIERDF